MLVTGKLSCKFVDPKAAEKFYLENDEMTSGGSKLGSKSSLIDSKSSFISELPLASYLPSVSSASDRLSTRTNTTGSSMHMSKLITIVSYDA